MTIDYAAPENDWEEPEETALRQRVGIRPTLYLTDGEHPDSRPCPAWCFGSHDFYKEHPLEATHGPGYAPRVAASRYRGAWNRSGPTTWISTAEVALELQQIGQAAPFIELGLHHHPDGHHVYENRLEVSIADARDLARALLHIADVAEGIKEVEQRSRD